MHTLTKTFGLLIGLSLTPLASAEPAAKPEAKADAKDADGDRLAIARCLEAWSGKHPFKGDATPAFKTLSTSVQVLGVGEDMVDADQTKEPSLVLVKPTVAVLTKSHLRLLNPNGWYCLKANVTVLAKTVLEIACNASIADSREGVAVLASNSQGTGKGVTVLGKTELKRVGCADAKGKN